MNIMVLATTDAEYPSLGGAIHQFQGGRSYDVPDGFAQAAIAAGWAEAAQAPITDLTEPAESKKRAKRGAV